MHRAAQLSLQVSRSACQSPLRAIGASTSSSSFPLQRRLALSRTSRLTAWSPQLQTRRWYADDAADKKAEGEGAGKKADGEGAKDGETELDKVKGELDAKSKEVVDLKDKYLRSVADFRNLQERSKRDQASARDFAITKFAKDLVESIDNLDRALGTVPAEKVAADSSNADLKSLYDGLKMTEGIMLSTLKKHGLERFDPAEAGEKFDPNKHEAAFMTKMEDKEDGTVFNTMQKGFVLNGRIIRAAKVGVVKNS